LKLDLSGLKEYLSLIESALVDIFALPDGRGAHTESRDRDIHVTNEVAELAAQSFSFADPTFTPTLDMYGKSVSCQMYTPCSSIPLLRFSGV